jgi:DNA-binding XRE family transcriptional regulator
MSCKRPAIGTNHSNFPHTPIKLPADSILGSDFRKHRNGRGLTQGQLAAEAGVAERTVRLLEQGQGKPRLMAIRPQAAPGGDRRPQPAVRHLAGAEARQAAKWQRELAAMVGVTQPTIVALERRDKGRLSTLERVLSSLGAGSYLAAIGQAKAFYTHAENSSTNQARETPVALLETLHGVFGRFDLDPCAPRRSRARVRARVHPTEEDDGLSVPWRGTVFVNPPYGRTFATLGVEGTLRGGERPG